MLTWVGHVSRFALASETVPGMSVHAEVALHHLPADGVLDLIPPRLREMFLVTVETAYVHGRTVGAGFATERVLARWRCGRTRTFRKLRKGRRPRAKR